jgi:hypothetical protein
MRERCSRCRQAAHGPSGGARTGWRRVREDGSGGQALSVWGEEEAHASGRPLGWRGSASKLHALSPPFVRPCRLSRFETAHANTHHLLSARIGQHSCSHSLHTHARSWRVTAAGGAPGRWPAPAPCILCGSWCAPPGQRGDTDASPSLPAGACGGVIGVASAAKGAFISRARQFLPVDDARPGLKVG